MAFITANWNPLGEAFYRSVYFRQVMTSGELLLRRTGQRTVTNQNPPLVR
ncbi:hypothetical protein ABVT39_025602 [Epinephelus coioides]